ncbi:hypothetical protein D3C80_1332590 [compost metagenome]
MLNTFFKERHLRHRTEAHAAELHRRARLQAADRVGEEHQVVFMYGIQRILNTALVVEQPVLRLLFRLFAPIPAIRHVKAHAAAEQGRQRAHFHAHALCRHVERHATVFPETYVAGHQLIVRRRDKQLIAHGALFGIEIAGFHRTDAVVVK